MTLCQNQLRKIELIVESLDLQLSRGVDPEEAASILRKLVALEKSVRKSLLNVARSRLRLV